MNDTVYGVSPGLVLHEMYTVGCGKVNCGNAAREGALGYDLGAPYGRAYVIPKTFRNNGNDSTIATKRRPMILRSAFCFI